ncbi:hypothetical protein GcM3_179037 [Golovinomyces cichoracearum]|uniref:Uncharacterized protein n=1 Tax=Golovinomyces cichoracearum TaxID=62708 RepID=A0A420HN40_9PEZI|nr:hypothetical protein GcM3_179037 [Golovinomyces cichoracearum]
MLSKKDKKQIQQNIEVLKATTEDLASASSGLRREYSSFVERIKSSKRLEQSDATLEDISDSLGRFVDAAENHSVAIRAQMMTFIMVSQSVISSSTQKSDYQRDGQNAIQSFSATYKQDTVPQQVQSPITLTPKRKARRVVTSARSTSLEPSTVASVAEEFSDMLEEKVEQDEDARIEITQGTNVTGGRRIVVERLRQSTQSVADTEYTAVSFGTNKNVESKDCPKANITPLEAVHMAAIANWVEKMGHGAPYYGLIMYSVNENILGNDLVIEILEYVRKRVSESTSYECLDELEDPDSYTSIWCTKLMERINL